MITIKNISGESIDTIISLNKEHAGLTHEVISSIENVIKGAVKEDKLGETIGSYTVSVPTGSRFKAAPTLSIGNANYTTTSTTNSDENGNIISKTFNIFKRI